VLGKSLRRGFKDFADHARFEPDVPGSVVDIGNPGAGLPKQANRFRVVAKLDTDLGQDGVGRLFDFQQAFFIQQIVSRDMPLDVRRHQVAIRRGITLAQVRAGYAFARLAGVFFFVCYHLDQEPPCSNLPGPDRGRVTRVDSQSRHTAGFADTGASRKKQEHRTLQPVREQGLENIWLMPIYGKKYTRVRLSGV